MRCSRDARSGPLWYWAPPLAPALEALERKTKLQLDQRLADIARFIGHWRGTAEGEPGTRTVSRTYTPILAGKFIEERNESRYGSGEVHHHLAFWSYDRTRGRFVLRLVMDSESIENIPAGFRARETYTFNGADAFQEIFEIAEPGADYQRHSHNRFTRARRTAQASRVATSK